LLPSSKAISATVLEIILRLLLQRQPVPRHSKSFVHSNNGSRLSPAMVNRTVTTKNCDAPVEGGLNRGSIVIWVRVCGSATAPSI
ncbi:hypothetical protein, partial [Salmonella enterica]|uniref:hypothetical protein n=1 Tax=Salmonella enterica TaxID=28901 RepID=UPI001C8CBF09